MTDIATSDMRVNFHFDKYVALKDRNLLKAFLKQIFIAEEKDCKQLSFIFCSDEFLLIMNKDFLNHDYFTDIITFDLSDYKFKEIMGEIYISVDTVTKNAAERNIKLMHELHRVIFHGVLHLCGYRDKTKSEIVIMRDKEDHYLSTYFNVPRETFRSMY